VERVRIADECGDGGVLGPPCLVRARSAAFDRARLPLVYGGGPPLPAPVAARREEGLLPRRGGELGRDLLEVLVVPHRMRRDGRGEREQDERGGEHRRGGAAGARRRGAARSHSSYAA